MSKDFFVEKSLLFIPLIVMSLAVFGFILAIQKPKDIAFNKAAILGDSDGNGTVDVLDFQILSNTFGKSPGQAGYDGRANFDGNPVIDILDFQILSNNFGRTGATNTPTASSNPTTTSGPTQPPLSGNVFWRGDAETGNISQWCHKHEFAPMRINVVTNPVLQGRYAYKFDYVNGDDNTGIQRVNLYQEGCQWERDGEEKYYGWSVYLPTDFPRSSLWTRLVQFKTQSIINPPINFNIVNDTWMITNYPTPNSGETTLWTGPVVKGQWDKWVAHVKWSTNPQVGFVEIWRNGNLVLPKRFTSTVHMSGGSPGPIFIAMGIIRHQSSTTNMTVYHDGFVVGSTYASVAQ